MVFLALFFLSSASRAETFFESKIDVQLNVYLGYASSIMFVRALEPDTIYNERTFREPLLPYSGGYCRVEMYGPSAVVIPRGTVFKLISESFREKSRFIYKVLRRSLFTSVSDKFSKVSVLCYAGDQTQLTNDIIARTLSGIGRLTFTP